AGRARRRRHRPVSSWPRRLRPEIGFAIADATPGRRPVSAVGFTLLDDRVQRTASAVPRLGYRAEQTTLFGRTMLSSPTRSRQRGSGRTRPAVAAAAVAAGRDVPWLRR